MGTLVSKAKAGFEIRNPVEVRVLRNNTQTMFFSKYCHVHMLILHHITIIYVEESKTYFQNNTFLRKMRTPRVATIWSSKCREIPTNAHQNWSEKRRYEE